ncbi:hypothetical protein P3T27_007499 [Kitasatospora sp. MAA19]|uniref:hypothetical protein n=1 Tax=unclassified Kitasatospora TaxID=2633591 RepID=UPI0024765A2D|nr:hypothetical protein [Kitasatospora sp. MAA19]MDH6710748.1 hypothetical protein [Kitasatospora sp. MAA19]
MTSDDTPTPGTLVPADEAFVAHAHALRRLVNTALEQFPLDQRASVDGAPTLSDAIELRELADEVVRWAAIAERERGATWQDLGDAAHSSRQAAHERWITQLRGWALINRRRRTPAGETADTRALAAELDAWYAELVPGEPPAISAHLAAADPRNEADRHLAQQHRTEAVELRARLDHERAYNAYMGQEPGGSKESWAEAHLARAEAYERLAVVEPILRNDHRQAALKEREIAAGILDPSAWTAERDGKIINVTSRGI